VGRITTLFVHKVVAQVGAGIDRAELLRSVGVDPDRPIDPKQMLVDRDYYALLERIAESDPAVVDLPLRTGASMRCEEYGALGLAMKSAPTARGSFERAERYARVLTNVAAYEVRDSSEGVSVHLHREGERRLGLRLSNEATLASLFTIAREVSTAPPRPMRVQLKHAAPAADPPHADFFGCSVEFDADHDALLYAPGALDVPNLIGDASVARFFDTHLESELAELGDDEALDRRVEIQISQALSEGVPTISDIARQLGMSGRTLQRRLSDRGRSFQGLVDSSRRKLAEKLLRETDFPLAEIAFLTGFAEQSAFNRAFKRWGGQTPRSYRIATRTP
jgi:AraC-like DNA-binding protein